ncbi:hypothetical protein BDV96DRAFT_508260 [Lophiotrema nucula]|uniref:Alpha and gamma adaptin binding protein p34-domain-containing protein n=1 Tax=Lophiotrema nucula TaxID=690887 RepID=A0A6A5YJ64_9PLEO|nr:hypothetical protein BDV96DRAFT_508260 [Lophiotrema nucula]
MEIRNPRRILALGAPDSGVLQLLKDLTGTAPEPTTDSTAGLSHTYPLTTKYYTATLPIWLDELPSPLSDWAAEFSKPEAREVIQVIGAYIFCFRKPVKQDHVEVIKDGMKAIADIIEKHMGYGGDAVCLAVGMPQSTTPFLDMPVEEWEEACMEYGFEYVDFEAKGKNEFGEERGVKRVEEALKANDWEGGDEGLDFDDEDGEGFGDSFKAEELEMGVELFGMKGALHGVDEEEEQAQVEELEGMMRRMIAIKDMGEGMPEAERKRFAAKAVNDLMKDF